MDEKFVLTGKGADTALGIISAICHDYDLENAAALNGMESDEAKVMLMIVASQAGLVGYIPTDFGEE